MKTQRKIILASASPSRKTLLEQIGLKFSVEPSDFQEDESLPLAPQELVQELSRGKARAVAKRHADAIVIGADTMAVLDGKVLGKPKDATDAKDMLLRMSGQRLEQVTGFTIIDAKSGKEITHVVETAVYFRKLSEAEINAYIASHEPFGHAGAYAIQGLGALLVEKIEGDYSNVVGLPVAAVAETLKEFGIDILGQ